MKFKKYIALLLFCLLTGLVFSQEQKQENNYKALKFKNFSLEEGLSKFAKWYQSYFRKEVFQQ